MRPPIVTPAPEDGRFYAVANLRTVEWQRHLEDLQGVADSHLSVLVIGSMTDAEVDAWSMAERAFMPLLLGELSTREERKALAAIKDANIPGLDVHPLPRRQRLKPLTRR